jgi:hypothetical protein
MKRRKSHPLRLVAWLIPLTAIIGTLSLLSYSTGLAQLVRSKNPAFGAWWDNYQFYFMEGAATALGLLVGIRIGAGFAHDGKRRSRVAVFSLIAAILIIAPLSHLCAMVARLGWNASSAPIASWLITREGYVAGRQVDKIAIAGIYFLKTAGFGLLAGLALAAIAAALVMGTGFRRTVSSSGPVSPGAQ